MSDVRTSFYGSSTRPSGDVPPLEPSDDSAQQHRDGAAVDRDDTGDGTVPRDDRGADDGEDAWDRDDPWSQGRSGGQSHGWWGHSQWGSYAHWDSHDEVRESRWQNHARPWHERRQSYGGTWGSASTGTGSVQDNSSRDQEPQEPVAEAWRTRGGAAMPGGWRPQKLGDDLIAAPKNEEGAVRGPSEKMIVPSFSGALEHGAEDIGASARSYMRQIAAWRRMTRIDPSRQALTLYQHLSGKAWIDAERLDVDKLAGSDGMEYYLSWVTDRYLDVQVTQVGRSLGDFFRRLRRQQGQSVRDYMSDYDRALARLQECGCHLPDIAAAWVFVDRMSLSEEQELNLLASVQNEYSLKRLQQAAIVQDRSLRKPWDQNSGQPRQDRGNKWWTTRRPHQANMADDANPDEDDNADMFPADDQSECVPEQVAEELFEAFMTHESAKQKYKEVSKLRGADPEGMRQLAADRLRQAKNKSFCSGCRRRGHWHKDPECPLNQQRSGAATSKGPGTGPPNSTKDEVPAKTSFACHYVYVTWDIDQRVATDSLTAITDTACSRSVAGVPWIEKYLAAARKIGYVPETVMCKDAFKFGASRIFDSSYAVVISFAVGDHAVLLRVAVVNGDVPPLVSRPALGQMGMIMDVAENTACFRKLGVQNLKLLSTDTGHPALPVAPLTVSATAIKSCDWQERELLIVPKSQQYTSYMTFHSDEAVDEENACLTIHDSWTVPEIRSIIQEDMKKGAAPELGGPFEIRPLTKMTVKDLESALEASGMAVPAKANKGVLMRLLRDQGGLGPQTILSFGRFRGQMYHETPLSYRRWAVKEVSENSGAQEDLKMYAAWAARSLEVTDGYTANAIPTPFLDSEESAKVPYTPESFGGSSWDLLPTSSTSDHKAKSKTKARPTKPETEVVKTSGQRRGAPSAASSQGSRMEQEVDPEVMDEIQYLQSRLGGTDTMGSAKLLGPTEIGRPAILAMSLFEATATRIQFLFSPANENPQLQNVIAILVDYLNRVLRFQNGITIPTDYQVSDLQLQSVIVVSQDVSPQLQYVIAILVDYLNPNFTDYLEENPQL
eukprot:s874_g17.t1